MAGALSAAARVVEEDAVAGCGQHARVSNRALAVAAAAVYEHDRRSVSARCVPAREADSIGGEEGNLAPL